MVSKKNKIKWFIITILGAILIGMIVLFPINKTKQLKNTTPTVTRVHLTAIGDSLTQGVGDPKHLGYPGRIKKLMTNKTTKISTYNAGVSGERSDQILKRIKNNQTLQKNIKDSQIIVLTVGGNDLVQLLEKNIMLPTNELNVKVANGSQQYAERLAQIFNDIRQINSQAPIYIYSLYNPFYVYFPNVTQVNQAITTYNQVISSTTKKYKKAYLLNINSILSHGQFNTISKLAKLKRDSNVNIANLTDPTILENYVSSQGIENKYLSKNDHFHPNAHGYDIMTEKLQQKMIQNKIWR